MLETVDTDVLQPDVHLLQAEGDGDWLTFLLVGEVDDDGVPVVAGLGKGLVIDGN